MTYECLKLAAGLALLARAASRRTTRHGDPEVARASGGQDARPQLKHSPLYGSTLRSADLTVTARPVAAALIAVLAGCARERLPARAAVSDSGPSRPTSAIPPTAPPQSVVFAPSYIDPSALPPDSLLLACASIRGTEENLTQRLGTPVARFVDTYVSPHTGAVDSILRLRFDGLTLALIGMQRPEGGTPASVVITSPRYTLGSFLTIGLPFDTVVTRVGTPSDLLQYSDSSVTLRYSIEGPSTSFVDLLFRGGSLIRIECIVAFD